MADTPLDRLLKRDRAITLVALAILCGLAWLYLLNGAGLGMDVREMTSFALFPHAQDRTGDMPMAMSVMPTRGLLPAFGSAETWSLMVAMWWVMMIAMMVPSAAPTILLYSAVLRRAQANDEVPRFVPTAAFVAGYLLIWLCFSIAAAFLCWLLERSGLLSVTMMGSRSRWFSGLMLMATGAYQLSPLKYSCLSHCRSPASFLSRHWKPGTTGALRLGVMHGVFCLGCCWLLMTLLFVGGVMNLLWIALLSLLVLVEKLLPGGRPIGIAAGLGLLVWGLAAIISGS